MSPVELLVVAPYPERSAPGQRFRFEQYVDAWHAAGIVPTVRSLLTAPEVARLHQSGGTAGKAGTLACALTRRVRDLAGVRKYDAVFLFREAFSAGPPILERLLAASGVPYILDFDDAIWLPNSTAGNARFAALKYTRKTASIARHATMVTVGNDYLASWTRQQGQPNVRVLPTTIDTDLYQPVSRVIDDGAPVCIGWSGSQTTIQHLRTLEEVLREVQRERGVRLRVIGDPSYRLAGADVEVLGWKEATELEDLSPIDIGVMPLPDDDWARGKCGLKALQYMALEIPTVMSPVGVNTEIADGGAAELASTPDEWRRVLLELVDDHDRRRELGKAGRQRVVERYSVTANAQRYVDAVLDVVKTSSRRGSANTADRR